MLDVVEQHFRTVGVEVSERLRIADYNVLPGVTSAEGPRDEWPQLRAKILTHDMVLSDTG